MEKDDDDCLYRIFSGIVTRLGDDAIMAVDG